MSVRRDRTTTALGRFFYFSAIHPKAPSTPQHISALTPAAAAGDAANARIWIKINGETRQDANTHDMIWSLPEIIAALSRWWELKPGDLIFTGSPSGVSALNPGDVIECGVDRLAPLTFSIAR